MSMLSTHLSSSAKVTNAPDPAQTNCLAGICFSVSLSPLFSSNQFWIVDSGATRHICSQASAFVSLHSIHHTTVTLPNHSQILVHFASDVKLHSDLVLKDVLFVPQFKFNLISVSALVIGSALTVSFLPNCFVIQDLSTKRMIGRGDKVQDLYILNLHYYIRWILVIFARPFESNNHLSKFPFDLVHCDIWGPYPTVSYTGHRFFLTLVDDCTRFNWVYLLKNKSDAVSVIPKFFNMVSTQFNAKIKVFRSDNAPELSFAEFFQDQAFVSTLATHRTKFQPRARVCAFLGYLPGVKGYKFYDVETKQVFLSRNALFHEEVFPFHAITSSDQALFISDLDSSPVHDPLVPSGDTSTSAANIPINDTPATDSSSTGVVLRKSTRMIHQPHYLKDYHCNLLVGSSTPASTSAYYPISNYISYHGLSDFHRQFLLSVSSQVEPQYYHQAVKFPEWRLAMLKS
ncbi:uncharacterized protein LOC116139474 [Pistacia vera]|uniref:uncharacterized protein LOC116139474 n=1 Tax=Pistacia vera TaxID=55513 RepID=UPI001263E3F2|nr:uncharacterized protein LOC116139474 [Pistacia vera]